ncbi:MAG: NAD(P)-binding protein [Deltaproteobacteria bacterium]|nr:NAD(P)-binding protein [Deltaproteobacteria bacterium]
MSGKPRYVILGAGLAGLTTADLLTRAGYEATCLEALPEVGGLARNINFKDHLFDIGGHRFFTDDERVAAYVRDLMGDELLDVVRKSRILLRGKFVDYPLRPMSALAGIGFLKSLHVLAGYAWVQLAAPGDQSNFESWVVRRFGKPLYDVYFGPYTQKVWGVDPIENQRGVGRATHPTSLAHAGDQKSAF